MIVLLYSDKGGILNEEIQHSNRRRDGRSRTRIFETHRGAQFSIRRTENVSVIAFSGQENKFHGQRVHGRGDNGAIF